MKNNKDKPPGAVPCSTEVTTFPAYAANPDGSFSGRYGDDFRTDASQGQKTSSGFITVSIPAANSDATAALSKPTFYITTDQGPVPAELVGYTKDGRYTVVKVNDNENVGKGLAGRAMLIDNTAKRGALSRAESPRDGNGKSFDIMNKTPDQIRAQLDLVPPPPQPTTLAGLNARLARNAPVAKVQVIPESGTNKFMIVGADGSHFEATKPDPNASIYKDDAGNMYSITSDGSSMVKIPATAQRPTEPRQLGTKPPEGQGQSPL